MFSYLEQLRKKPEHARRKSVFLISLSVTFIILVIWGVSLFFRISTTDFSFNANNLESKVPSLKDTFSHFVSQIGNMVGFDDKTPAVLPPSAIATTSGQVLERP